MGDKPEFKEDMESYKKAIDSTTEAQQDFFKKFSSLQLDAMHYFLSCNVQDYNSKWRQNINTRS